MDKLEKNKITYFNNDVMIVYKEDFPFDIDCVIDDNGYKLLKVLPELNTIEISGGTVLVNKKTKIAIFNANMPDFAERETDHQVNISSVNLANAFKFIGDNLSKPILKGIFVGETGTIVATDSFKMYIYDNGESNGIVLSPELVKALIDANSDFVLKYNDRFAYAEFESYIVYGRLLQGNFPHVFGLFTPSGNIYSFDYEKLKKSLEIGSLTKARVVEINDKKITFAGEVNSYIDDTDLEIKINLSFNSLKTALSVYNFKELYYTTFNKPIMFVNDKEKILLVGMN